MTEAQARAILEAAIQSGRSVALLECLFDGGSATLDSNGLLLLISGGFVQQAVDNIDDDGNQG